jgi:hypothetical protein
MSWKFSLIAVVLLLPAVVPGAGDAPTDRATIQGIKAVTIVLDPLSPELKKAGLNETDFRTRIEDRLREAQIPVDQNAAEFLGLKLTSVRGNRGPFAVAFSLGVYQPVVLSRDRNVHAAPATWEVESVLMADPKALAQASAETVDELAGRFVAAWRAVNPK